ncbi:MAG TPA: cytochrome c [Steroidobacter sp.]|jgi:mono/diheme cytochrome c family protein|nr:cytochrome c [Steroidobacteraceae bacterium]HLS81344.1 cytochrome c [Steroidobacter sp.]
MPIARLAVAAAALVMLAACQSIRPEAPLEQQSGLELYQRLCASCHGVDGRGDGPVAPLIKTGVPDLTRLALRDGGEFPTEDVRRIIDGRYERPAHGPRDMPVWGWRLYDMSSEDGAGERARVDAMIGRLVEYLRSIQATS